MTSEEIAAAAPLAANDRALAKARQFLFGPALDFFFLGGVSFLILPVLLLIPDSKYESVLGVTIAAAFVVNYPHFASSYQIFYRGFMAKAFGDAVNRTLRLRYIFAGLIAPLGLIALLGIGLMQPDTRVLGYTANLMVFLVGWHYAKQAYGILIVDSVLKKRFFNDKEKLILRLNAHACWIMYWITANWLGTYHRLFQISFYDFHIPQIVVYAMGTIAIATSAAAIFVFLRKDSSGQGLPLNGVMAYVVTLYLWFFGQMSPMMFLIIPALHSLQYLIVVGRYEVNRGTANKSLLPHVIAFAVLAVIIGYVGFSGIPLVLTKLVDYRHDVFGNVLFYFVFSIFINVHHYFLDNVIWRGENPETRAYLFAAR